MTDKDLEEFCNIINHLAIIFEKELSSVVIKTYFKILSKYDIGEVRTAAGKATQKLMFFPKPKQLIDFIEGGKPDRARKAWLDLLGLVKKEGSCGSPTINDPILQEVIQLYYNGWGNLCSTLPADHEKLQWWEKNFVDMYQTVQDIEAQKNLIALNDFKLLHITQRKEPSNAI